MNRIFKMLVVGFLLFNTQAFADNSSADNQTDIATILFNELSPCSKSLNDFFLRQSAGPTNADIEKCVKNAQEKTQINRDWALIYMGVYAPMFATMKERVSEQNNAANNNTNSQTSIQEPEFSASQVFNEFQANEYRANNLYKDKEIIVSGKITSITVTFNQPTVRLDTGDLLGSVGIQFSPEEEHYVAELSKGDFIKIKGICKGVFITDVIIDNAIVLTHTYKGSE